MKSKFSIIFSISIIMVIVFFGVNFFVISNISQKYEDMQNISNNIQTESLKSQKLSNLKKSLKNANVEGQALSALFLKVDDIPNFIQSIEDEMKNLKITGTTKSVSERSVPELTSAAKDELLVSIEAESTYPNLMQFVSILENLPYKSYISSITIAKENPNDIASQNSKISAKNLWKVNLTLNVVKIKIPNASKLSEKQ